MIRRPSTRSLCIKLVGVVSILALLGACTSNGSPGGAGDNGVDAAQGEPQRGGTLAIALNSDPLTLDWTSSTADDTKVVAWNIFEQLFSLDKDYSVQPMLANGYTVSKDGLTYTIDLRQDVKFHDGSLMKAEDVVASVNRWGKISTTGIDVFRHVKDITAKDDHTVVVNLKSPFAPLIADLADIKGAAIIIPASIATAAGTTPLTEKQLVGTGPYEFGAHSPGHLISLERFADYSPRAEEDLGGLAGAKHAYLDQLDFHIVTDAQVRIDGLQTDQYDFAFNVPTDLYEQVKAIPDVHANVVTPRFWLTFVFNKAAAPFNDVRLRQAVMYGTNLDEMAKAAIGTEELYEIDGSIFYPEQKRLHTLDGSDEYNVFDLSKAKALLADAAYDGAPIRLLTSKSYSEFYNASVAFAAQLKAIGFNVDIQVVDWATLVERRADPKEYEIFSTGGSPSFDPTAMVWLAPSWPGWYESPKMQSLRDEWAKTLDEPTKMELLAEMNKTVYEEVPLIKGANYAAVYANRTELSGYPNWMDATFWNVWINGGA